MPETKPTAVKSKSWQSKTNLCRSNLSKRKSSTTISLKPLFKNTRNLSKLTTNTTMTNCRNYNRSWHKGKLIISSTLLSVRLTLTSSWGISKPWTRKNMIPWRKVLMKGLRSWSRIWKIKFTFTRIIWMTSLKSIKMILLKLRKPLNKCMTNTIMIWL